ncbi:MAG: LuxR family transcriptional regulator [Bacteroidales bacterium]|nr:LuxR family transcriptional regulator [Bacteroidales bacterium]
MKRILLIALMLIPVVAWGYGDHRGRDLDSLERSISHWTPEALKAAPREQQDAYCQTCYDIAYGYLQVDSPRTIYYAQRAIQTAGFSGDSKSTYRNSILIGQIYWAKEQLDSARFYYNQASDALAVMEASWDNPDKHDLEAMQSRLWGTLGNFYAVQDSLEKFAYYYAKAGEIFEKWEWWEDCSTLHRNIGEVYTDGGNLKKAKPEYELGLKYAKQSGDSLIIAHALYGLGRWYQESGKTTKALEYLTQADVYFGEHRNEESQARANTLAIMNAAHEELYRNARMLGIASFLVILLSIGGTLLVRRLRLTRVELTETSAVLDETIEELRPAAQDTKPVLNEQERAIARLLVEGWSTKEIAEEVHLGVNTVLWYRKRLYAKFDVHNAAAFATEISRRGILE